MFRHGLRVSELCDLRKVDLDLKSSRIWVARKKGSLSTEQSIEGDTLRFVKRYLKERADHLPWLIVTERGTQFTRFGINYLVKRAGVDAGLPVHGGIYARQEANDTRSPLELLIHSIDDVLDVVDMAYPAECLDRNPVTFKLHYPFDAQTDREHDIRLLKRQVKALKAILREINAWDDTVLSRGVRCGTRSVFGPCYS